MALLVASRPLSVPDVRRRLSTGTPLLLVRLLAAARLLRFESPRLGIFSPLRKNLAHFVASLILRELFDCTFDIHSDSVVFILVPALDEFLLVGRRIRLFTMISRSHVGQRAVSCA